MRLKFRISEILSHLRDDIGRKMPDFDSEAYADKLAKNVAEMRGRELPGFGSTRLLLSTVRFTVPLGDHICVASYHRGLTV